MLKQLKHKIGLLLMKKLGDGKLFVYLKKVNSMLFHYNDRTKKRSFGNKNPDKTFYIITPNGKEAGLISMFWNTAVGIEYALSKGYCPVVDMQNYECQYSVDNKTNAWDIFFKQPTDFSLDEVYHSKNVIIRGSGDNSRSVNSIVTSVTYDNDSNKKKQKFILQYADVNKGIKDEAKLYRKEHENNNILGVFLRGTDFVALKPSGHNIQPTAKQVMEKVDEFLQKYPIDSIFLVTEDEKIRSEFQEKYGDILLPNMGATIENYDEKDYICYYLSKEEKINNAKIYLQKLIILSECDYLISSLTNGSVYSLAYNCDFKDSYIFDLGRYK